MKIKQTVETEFHSVHINWRSIIFSDLNDNEVSVSMTDDEFLQLADRLDNKKRNIQKERAERAELELQKIEGQDD